MNPLFRCASLLVLASLALLAHATDAYSNLGSPASYVSYDVQPGYTFGYDGISTLNVAYGFQFAATATGTLTGFRVAINQVDGRSNRDFSLGLYADSGSNTLGSLLGTYAGTSTGVDSATTTALSTVAAGGTPVLLAAGAKYWLVASIPPRTDVLRLGWNRSKSPAATPMATLVSFNGRSSPPDYGSDVPAAFSVQVNPVPEPASMAGLGLGAVAALRRRKRA